MDKIKINRISTGIPGFDELCEGGFVEIIVADGTDDAGVSIPGQIQKVTVTSPGKNYTTATIDAQTTVVVPGTVVAVTSITSTTTSNTTTSIASVKRVNNHMYFVYRSS